MDQETKTILVIEDDEILRDNMTYYLEDLDYHVLTAANGKIGVDIIRDSRPDLILTDLRMPEMDGLKVLEHSSKIAPDTPIIVVSGTGNITDSVQALRLGAWDYILKPIRDMSIISIAIDKSLEKARLKRENREYQKNLEMLVQKRTAELEQANLDLASINKRLRVVVETTRKLSVSSNIIGFGKTLIEEFARHTKATGGSLFLLEKNGIRQLSTLDASHVPAFIPFPLEEGTILKKTLDEKQAILIPDIESTPNITPSGWGRYKNGSLLSFPLSDLEGNIIGIITLHCKTKPPFIEQDKEIGIILASYSCETLRALHATETLKSSESRFRDLAEMLPEAIFETDESFLLTYANRRAFELFGYSQDEFEQGINGLELIIRKERSRARRNISLRILRKEFGRVEYQFIKKNGKTFSALLHITPIWDREQISGFRGIIIDITERKNTEQQIRNSEERLKILFEHAPDAYYLIDLKGNLIDGNKAAEQLMQYKKEELIGKNLIQLSLLQGKDIPRASAALAKNVIGKSTGPDEFELNRKDGTKVHVEIITHPVKMQNKTIVLGMARDITQRVQAEKALRQSEEKYRTIIDKSPVGIFYYNQKGIITECNKQFVQIIGSSYEQLIGFNMPAQLKDKKMLAAVKQSLNEGFANYEDRYTSVTANKETFTRVMLKGIRNEKNEIIAGLGLVEDISVRKKAQDELLKFKLGIEHSTDGIFMTDIDGKIIYTNPAFQKIYRFSVSEIYGKTPRILKSGQLPREFYKIFWQKLLNRETIDGEIVNKTKNNQLVTIEYSINPIISSKNEILGFLAIHRDVTERKLVEMEREKLKKLESVGVLAGGIAHDFNNLLTGLFGNIELAKMFLTPDHKSHRFIEAAEQSMENAIHLTKQLLTFAKGGEPVKETLAIGEVVSDMAEFSISGSKAKLINKIAQNLWSVEADKGQIGQVISNLVINAMQAMPQGGNITISAENARFNEGKFVQITITDEGIGIAPQHLDKIFDPYFSTKQTGSGLGLASTHSIITKHNGKITVHSKLNEGTTFTIYLPALKNPAQRNKEPSETAEPVAAGPLTTAHVLVLDDEKAVREVISAMLEKMGYSVTLTREGEETVDEYRKAYHFENAYNLVILDLTIPAGMGGVETAKRILDINPKANIIVSSGYATDPVMANYKKYGFKGVSAKPYRYKELKKVIDQIIKS